MKTSEQLAIDLQNAGAPAAMVGRARDGFYDEYETPIALPISALVNDAREAGLHEIAQRAMDGYYDATKAEADAWAKSPEGQAAFRSILG